MHIGYKTILRWTVLAALIGLVAIGGRSLMHLAELNYLNLLALQAFMVSPELAEQAYSDLTDYSPRPCQAEWLRGLLAEQVGQMAERDHAWLRLLTCDETYLPLVYERVHFIGVSPTVSDGISQHDWAEAAYQAYPENALAMFWLAESYLHVAGGLLAPIDPADLDRVVELYRQALTLEPFDGVRWRELGDLLYYVDPQSAIQAYLMSCHNGDPGSNGCYRAGLRAEESGDIPAAISYYRLSQWSAARQRADELEQQLFENGQR